MKSNLLVTLGILFAGTLSAQTTHINEDFSAPGTPVGWSNSAISGNLTWNFGVNGSASANGNNNLNGSSMAFFDDDDAAGNQLNNTVELKTPVFDNSNAQTSTLSFQYNFREMVGVSDQFKVEVYDGQNWNTVLAQTSNNCGNWTTCSGNYPLVSIDISAYKNVNCQIRFIYEDGNDWAWYVGLDDVVVQDDITTSIEVIDLEETPFQVSPNPSNGIFKVNLKNAEQSVNYRVTSVLGALVKAGTFTSTKQQINLTNQPKGVYFLTIEKTNQTKKIIIH